MWLDTLVKYDIVSWFYSFTLTSFTAYIDSFLFPNGGGIAILVGRNYLVVVQYLCYFDCKNVFSPSSPFEDLFVY